MTTATVPSAGAVPADEPATGSAGPGEQREQRLVSVLGRASGRFRLVVAERWLAAVGGGLVVAGVVAVLVGYLGTSRTVLVAGQIPYLVSGGLFGLALVFLGGFLYFAHWLALLVRESRERGAQDRQDLIRVADSVAELTRTLDRWIGLQAPSGAGRAAGAARPSTAASVAANPVTAAAVTDRRPAGAGGGPGTGGVLVATANGSMAHRPECPAVAGRDNLRTVTAADGLKPCGICQPEES
jgi:hypothetical protein